MVKGLRIAYQILVGLGLRIAYRILVGLGLRIVVDRSGGPWVSGDGDQ